MNWYLKVLKNYIGFKGRARRKEYWMFNLFHIIFLIVATVLDTVFKTNMSPLPYGLIYFGYAFALLLPGLAATVRRLHDIGKSGGWIFIALVPIIGSIWLLVLLCTNGEVGENRFGPDPKTEPTFNGDALDSHLAN